MGPRQLLKAKSIISNDIDLLAAIAAKRFSERNALDRSPVSTGWTRVDLAQIYLLY